MDYRHDGETTSNDDIAIEQFRFLLFYQVQISAFDKKSSEISVLFLKSSYSMVDEHPTSKVKNTVSAAIQPREFGVGTTLG